MDAEDAERARLRALIDEAVGETSSAVEPLPKRQCTMPPPPAAKPVVAEGGPGLLREWGGIKGWQAIMVAKTHRLPPEWAAATA